MKNNNRTSTTFHRSNSLYRFGSINPSTTFRTTTKTRLLRFAIFGNWPDISSWVIVDGQLFAFMHILPAPQQQYQHQMRHMYGIYSQTCHRTKCRRAACVWYMQTDVSLLQEPHGLAEAQGAHCNVDDSWWAAFMFVHIVRSHIWLTRVIYKPSGPNQHLNKQRQASSPIEGLTAIYKCT